MDEEEEDFRGAYLRCPRPVHRRERGSRRLVGVAVDLDLAVLVVASLADEYPHPVEERAGQPGGYHGCEFRPRADVSYPQPLGGGVFADAPAGDTPTMACQPGKQPGAAGPKLAA